MHDADTRTLAGFAMISHNVPRMDDDLIGPYYLWNLFIEHRLQRRGYGAATLHVIAGYLATRPGADVRYSCADGAGSPRALYLRYGSPTHQPGHAGREHPRPALEPRG